MHVHLIGVAGTAMAALARLLQQLGHRVTGSDHGIYPPMSDELERMGIVARSPYHPGNLDPCPDLVVVGNAIARGNPELEACLDRGLAYTSQAEAIEDLVLPGRRPIVVAGTHGKTTTTALLAWLLERAGRSPGWFVGGVPHDLEAPSRLGKGADFVIEGDEYDTVWYDKRPKFHHYRPRVLIVNNVEYDHADIYPDLAAIELEFRRLVNVVPSNGLVLAGSASGSALAVTAGSRAPVQRFGFEAEDVLRATDVAAHGSGMRFVMWNGDLRLGEVELALAGRFNVRNALAALGAGLHLGVPFPVLVAAAARFRGVKRRLELRGTEDGVAVYDDFAHHPTAIRETVEALRARGVAGRIFAALEPRSWSMRRNVHQDTLAPALAAADVVLLAPVYEIERVPPGCALDVSAVLEQARKLGREAALVEGAADLARVVAERARPGDAVLVMSNGGFDGAHGRILAALAARARLRA